ncbi:zinc finger protein Xfin [Helicoverpa armigera]|uniref:zinc finger protein Xfin n=1 Tax=Helicoverpa armigera TaxID=29058 RepID=UPI003082BF1E
MNHTGATLQGNMDVDPLSSYEYPTYNPYPAPTYPYPNKLQSMYQAYHNNANYVNNSYPQEPYQNNVPTQSTEPIEEDKSKTVPESVVEPKPVARRKKKEKSGQKSTYCSEKIMDSSFKFYGCSICNISYTALHELDQHVTVHKNRMTSYRLRLRNQFKKKQIKKEKKKLKKLIKVKKENFDDIEIKPEDGYIGNEKASEVISNGINNSEQNVDVNNSIEQTDGQTDSNTENTISNNATTELSNGGNTDKSTEDSVNNMNGKENSMDETEMNNLEKIYKCFACQKQFTLSYYLKLHVRSHTDEKPYTCSACGQSFITASKLGRHNKRIHLAQRYQCRICFKIYSRFELLTAHFDKTHPEDKLEGEPYDYNAILPYLKELEEQLRTADQPDEPDCKMEGPDNKPDMSAGLWEQGVGPYEVPVIDSRVKQESQDEDQKDLVPKIDKIDIVIENVKLDSDLEVKVKQEVSDDEGGMAGMGGDGDEVGDDGDAADAFDVKGEDSTSDEDYFPSNTWAAPPSPPPSSPPRRGAGGAGGGSGRTCPVCHKRVSSASYMRVHARTHTGERPYKCYMCGRGFITSSKMHRHVLTHQTDKGEDTKVEPETETAEDQPTDIPAAEDDGDTKPAKKKSKMKSKLSKAKSSEEKPRRKHQKRPHACEYCNQKFLHLNMLEVHRQSHAGEARVLRCQYCLEPCDDAAARAEHEATHAGAKPYLCTICGKQYKKRETMVYHRKRHSPDKELVCEVCSARFTAACKLSAHMATHRAARFVLRYECPVCAHMFHTRYHVRMHLNTHQREGLILEENRSEVLAMVLQNARKIPKQGDAPQLTDTMPTDERSRVCNICGEVFHHFYYLEEHLKSHGSRIAITDIDKPEDKKYICEICNKGFKLHYYLKLHLFTHSKEKPFICQQCGKGFITKGKLKRHLETHTGLKKYQCHICYKFFTRPSYLRIHIRTIHGTQDYNFRFDKSYGLGLSMSAGPMSDVSQNSV